MRVSVIGASLATFAALAAGQNGAIVENEFVRVVQATDQPHKASAPHQHKQNRVMIYLDSGDIDLKYAGGKVEHQHWKPGDVAWSPAGGVHTSENVSERPIRIIEIELRRRGDSGAAAEPPDRTHAVIDNSQVRVYKGSTPPAKDHYVAVNTSTGTVAWDHVPQGSAIVITEIK
jgi:uncharacterized RmlC-like cupin family protein